MKPSCCLIWLLSAALVGCDNTSVARPAKVSLDPLFLTKVNLAFTCVHETIPESPTEADVLFQYSRWLQKNNQLKQDKSVDAEIERLYRIARENGHYKAKINLQYGQGPRPDYWQTVRITHQYLSDLEGGSILRFEDAQKLT